MDLKELKKFEDLTFNVNGKVLNKNSSSVTDTYSCDYINNMNNYSKKLFGAANNSNETITLVDEKISDYKFITVLSGYGDNVSCTTIPVIAFIGSYGTVCRQHVKTYNGYGYTSIKYIDDTSFIIRGAVEENTGTTGQDTTTLVYGIK